MEDVNSTSSLGGSQVIHCPSKKIPKQYHCKNCGAFDVKLYVHNYASSKEHRELLCAICACVVGKVDVDYLNSDGSCYSSLLGASSDNIGPCIPGIITYDNMTRYSYKELMSWMNLKLFPSWWQYLPLYSKWWMRITLLPKRWKALRSFARKKV